MLARVFYIQWKEGERELDSRDREHVREAEDCDRRKVASAIKLTVRA
jgi:hypothetical protein